MNFHQLISYPKVPKILTPPCQRFQFHNNYLKSKIRYSQVGWQKSQFTEGNQRKKLAIIVKLKEKKSIKVGKKKGSIAGAVALIIGTSIGTGILALPSKTSPAGLVPSSISLTMCWAFLLIEALILVEINVDLLKKKKIKVEDDELDVISIRTMAQETLGEWGGALATVTYVFLGYTSVIAYSSKSGEILHHLTHFPESISGAFFTALFAILISVGGTRATDQVNQWLTVSMIGLLIAIEVVAAFFGGWSGFGDSVGHWEKVPSTLPVMIFALVYHDLTPVLCAYLEGDRERIRASILVGSVVPLLALLVWEAIALSLPNQGEQLSDPVELLLSVRWGGVSFMVEAFSLLAVGTSLIGTLLSFSEFFKEQLNRGSPLQNSNSVYYMGNWWKKNKASVTASIMVIVPPLIVSTTIPDAFYAATDFAGGYCMTMLYGVLPPAMAWAMNNKREEETTLSKVGPTIVGVGLFACGVIVEQILQDFSFLHP